MADGTDGELITWDAAGAPTTVAAGTADQVLTSNGVGTAPTFQDAGGGSDILVETVAMPTSGWAVDGTYSDFYSATVSITGLFESTDVALATPLAEDTTDVNAWASALIVRIDRVSDTSIKIYSRIANTNAVNFQLLIMGGNATSTPTVTIGNVNPYVPYSGGDPLSGGTSTTSGLYTIRTFSSSDTLDIYTPTYVQYLCVAGGGAGSRAGGGGGGMRFGYITLTTGTIAVEVGAGGVYGGVRGGSTSIGSYVSCTGGGSATTQDGYSGGSGAGGDELGDNGGSGTSGEGNAGGAGDNGGSTSDEGGGGGGGKGSAGQAGQGNVGGDAGNGLANSITGTSIYYAGGQAGTGDGGSGSAGSQGGVAYNNNGIAGRGSGGDTGGSGVVILRYLT